MGSLPRWLGPQAKVLSPRFRPEGMQRVIPRRLIGQTLYPPIPAYLMLPPPKQALLEMVAGGHTLASRATRHLLRRRSRWSGLTQSPVISR